MDENCTDGRGTWRELRTRVRLARRTWLTWLCRYLASPGLRDFALYAVMAPMLVSAIIYTLSDLGSETEFVGGLADQAQDRYAAIHANAVRPAAEARSIVFLDYDDATFSALSDPLLVPPATIATSLRRLARTPPWATVVDLDLTYLQDAHDLEAVKGGLETLADAGTAIFLARPALSPPPGSKRTRYRPSSLDTFVKSRDDIAWVNVAFEQSKDGVVRALKPVAMGWVGGTCEAYPSVPLALRLLKDAGSPGLAKAAFSNGIRAVDCERSMPRTLTFEPSPKRLLAFNAQDGDIEFAFEWRPATGLQRLDADGGGRAQALSIPLGPLLTSDAALAPETFRDTLVVIGRTADQDDFHQTPLGEMPGALILANAARAWLDLGPVQRSFWPGLLLVLAATLCISALSWSVHKMAGEGRTRWFVRKLLPPLLLSGLWIVFYLSGNPFVSAGLMVSSIMIMTSVELGCERVQQLERRRRMEQVQ